MDPGVLLEPEGTDCGDAEGAGGAIMNCGYQRIFLKIKPEKPPDEYFRILPFFPAVRDS